MELYHENEFFREDAVKAAKAAGRRIVAIGGGTGLSALLLGLKEYTDNITAVVTVTDDGGGSGKIREEFGVLPPGDIRNCLLALANTSSMMSDVLNYRFTEGSLKGQSFGNLFLLALNQICGSFDRAVANMNEILAVTGRVLPVTNTNVNLRAVFEDGSVVDGETSITLKKKDTHLSIAQIDIIPHAAVALDSVIDAINEADLIILGPGSLYTSVIPNLLVGNVANAVKRSPAYKVYVQNIMTQDGETENFTASEHIGEINRYGKGHLVDVCIYNTTPVRRSLLEAYSRENSFPVEVDKDKIDEMGIKLFGAEILARDNMLVRHDPLRLAYNIMLMANIMVPRKGMAGKYDQMLLERE
ncbi:MAG: YvcK family protein [Clostridia bacterium]|nr:YvcK family protein [Clostridia bacterium]MBQ5813424.1 YvcK family protein [Clostridia bacterium]